MARRDRIHVHRTGAGFWKVSILAGNGRVIFRRDPHPSKFQAVAMADRFVVRHPTFELVVED